MPSIRDNSPNPRTRPRIILPLLISLGVIVVVLVGAEFYLRAKATHIVRREEEGDPLAASSPEFLVKYTSRGRRLIPHADVIIRNHHLCGRDIAVRTNSRGFRGEEIPADKEEGEIRILVLGDSITWGDYLAEEDVYVTRLGKELSHLAPETRWRSINAGVGDIGITEEIDILTEQGLAVEPDLVILAFYLNDSRPPWGFPGELDERGFLRRHSVLAETIYRNLLLRRWINQEGKDRLSWISEVNRLPWSSNRGAFQELARWAKFDWGASWNPDSWSVVGENLDKLKNLAEQHGFRVIVVVFPVAFQVYADFLEDLPQRTLEKMARERGFACLDLLPLLRSKRDHPLFYDQCHPTPAANAWIGEAIARFILAKPGLIDCQRAQGARQDAKIAEKN